MYELEYTKPSNISNAVNEFDQSKDGKYLAGGMTLIPTLKARLASSDILIDLKEANLSNISVTSTHVVIGSMTRHSDVANSADVQKSIPSLSKLAGGIGDHMVRNCGTIGGSVANNDPSACYPSAVLGLGATITTNERELSAEDYFMGMFETALNSNEIITNLKVGETFVSNDTKIVFENINQKQEKNYKAILGNFSVENPDGTTDKMLPELRIYNQPNIVTSEADIKTTLLSDKFIVINLVQNQEYFNVRYQVKPFMLWIWLSVLLVSFGGLVSFFKRNKHEK